ncbi:diguanylate cyclase [Methylobacterium terricola]|uniref:Diguanylate cyclase n=1 Tax=Methylobacterium terricola TaxID=2583531 RepID=A0A5C4LIB0_9HYPH|nr:diguanylate cyclase [Methylobacterium terricola]TNC12895.1 diguanylate cyclase [Methylobacterium terricola]
MSLLSRHITARGPSWTRSLLGRITIFVLASVMLAYALGSGTALLIMVRGQSHQWEHDAGLYARVASTALRGIYTFVSVHSDRDGRVNWIETGRPVGDDQSIVTTGFMPADVLALASAQTGQDVWLVTADETGRLTSLDDSQGQGSGLRVSFPDSDDQAPRRLFTGWIEVGSSTHFAGFMPILSKDGRLIGGLVASIGSADALLAARNQALWTLTLLMMVTLAVSALMGAIALRRAFRPIPALTGVLTALADNETGVPIPFQERTDELGQLAIAIEKLRCAVVERGLLRRIGEHAAVMEHRAHHDSLTGLPNRARFTALLDAALERMAAGTAAYNLMLLDLDRFKEVNDTLGHAAGDAVLVDVGRRMAALLAPDDVVARLGGDEFALLQRVDGNDGVQRAHRLAHAIVAAVARPFAYGGTPVSIGVSIGIAGVPEDGAERSVLLKRADLALYVAKKEGRGRVALHRPGMTMRAESDGLAQSA